jgi:hypothetical protein
LKVPDGTVVITLKMPTKYQVFCDNLSGMTWCPALGAETLEEAVSNIQEGAVGQRSPSQHWMYHVYILHQQKVPYWGAKPDVYKHVKTVAGALVSPTVVRRKEGLQYALTIWEEGWLFADNLF